MLADNLVRQCLRCLNPISGRLLATPISGRGGGVV